MQRALPGCLFQGLNPQSGSAHPAQGTKHQIVSLKLAAALLDHATAEDLGIVLQAPYNVILAKDTIVQPDILFVRRERSGLIGSTDLKGAPDLVAEILDSATEQRVLKQKRKIYSGFGVREYWLIDPAGETAKVMAWSEIGYILAGSYSKSGKLTSPLLAGLRLPLSKIF